MASEGKTPSSSPVDILLVEDNPSDVELVLRALRKSNITQSISVVRDGAAAIEFIFGEGAYGYREIKHCPRLILLDLKLPKVDGLEVVQKIKSDARTKMIPIVMLTSSREEQDVLKSYTLGVNSYIVKPVDFEKFRRSIDDIGVYWLRMNQPPCGSE